MPYKRATVTDLFNRAIDQPRQTGIGRAARRVVALLCFAVCAYLIAPFAPHNNHILVPPGLDLDSTEEAHFIADGIDRLLTRPSTYYDTNVLYPDHRQLRTTEPLLGFALLGLPFRALGQFDDARLFEAVRWTVVWISLVYAYLFLRMLAIEPALAFAGAVSVFAQPRLLFGIDRLQLLSLGLIFPVLYYAARAWFQSRVSDMAGLFVFAALFPLCGIYNATIVAVAAILLLPLLVRMASRKLRQAAPIFLGAPVLLAAVVDVVVLLPWLTDRDDLSAYVSAGFMKIKDWNTTQAPRVPETLPDFLTHMIGLSSIAGLTMLAVLWARRRRNPSNVPQTEGFGTETWLQLAVLAVCVSALLVCAVKTHLVDPFTLPLAKWALDLSCITVAVLLFRAALRVPLPQDARGLALVIRALGPGLAVLLFSASFGPIHVSNFSVLASHPVNALLAVLPQLQQMRQFERFWLPGGLVLSVYLTVALGWRLRDRAARVRYGAAALLLAASLVAIDQRPVLATDDLRAPADLMALAAHSTSTGAVYVYPLGWNELRDVTMTPAARALRRPFVNGYTGIKPPWLSYATDVLNRFPDPESLWLLRHWRVSTVLVQGGSASPADDQLMRTVYQGPEGVVYELADAVDTFNPSNAACESAEGPERLELSDAAVRTTDGGNGLLFAVPSGFRATRLQIAFGASLVYVNRLPDTIAVFDSATGRATRLNQRHTGEWIASLAADALLGRKLPVATIVLDGSHHTALDVVFEGADSPVVQHVSLCGWSSGQ